MSITADVTALTTGSPAGLTKGSALASVTLSTARTAASESPMTFNTHRRHTQHGRFAIVV